MIIYGYLFDTDDLNRAERKLLDGSLSLEGCYSTGAGRYSAAVFGVTLDGFDFLFNPVKLSELNLEPSQKQMDELADHWSSVPQAIRAKSKDAAPAVYVFDASDD